jgi:hypothetical protein
MKVKGQPVEAILRRGRRKRKNNGGNEQMAVCIYRNVTMNPPVQLLYTNKNFGRGRGRWPK